MRSSLGAFLAGMSLVLGFAPFHLPGISLISIACLFTFLQAADSPRAGFFIGFSFGLGFFSLGISWLFVSIHHYGHFNYAISAGLTGLFIIYLALYQGLIGSVYLLLNTPYSRLFSALLFSAVWCGSEALRATVFGGFPWLMLGFGQIDSPLGQLLPLIGVLGVSALTAFLGALLALAFITRTHEKRIYLIAFTALFIAPMCLTHKQWSHADSKSLSVGIIQANLSMRDKWDPALFWQILDYYQQAVQSLLGQALIVMPESAIPLPGQYVSDYLTRLHEQAFIKQSGILLGIPQTSADNESMAYNALIGLGTAKGHYHKQHLVAFGEFIPAPLKRLNQWLNLPMPNVQPGLPHQRLMSLQNHPFATLICYELAYPQLLRKQLPRAEWIVSISDDGWFGHSFAIYQQLQMAQVLSKLTARYQVVSNNDGLSSVIDSSGLIIQSLPAFSSGTLRSFLHTSHGITPWVNYGDGPLFAILLTMLLFFVSTSFIYKLQLAENYCRKARETVS